LRLRLIIAAILLVFIALTVRIYYFSVKSGDYYAAVAQENVIKTRLIPPTRGQILDRNGEPLAINKLGFSISLEPHLEGAELENLVGKIANSFDELNSTKIIREYKRQNSPYNHEFISIVDFLDYNATTEKFTELNLDDRVRIAPSAQRHYPYNSLASHVIGYVGRVTQKDIDFDKNLTNIDYIGKSGVEGYYNKILQGEFGSRKTKVTVLNEVIEELEYVSPVSHDIKLSIDMRLQEFLRELFSDKAGAAIIIDVQTGEILASGSFPEYNLNPFVTGISSEDWAKIIEDLDHPFTNKMTSGLYPPGSVFKMGVGMSFLNSGLIDKDKTYACRGYIELGGRKFRCWRGGGHGKIDLISALRQSCDVYFYEGSLEVGIDFISEDLMRYGFGRKTGVDLMNEYIGTVPNKAWKREKYGKPWYNGETVNASIGQGDVLVTPMQVAKYTAQIASGKGIVPHYIKEIDEIPLESEDANLSAEMLNLKAKFAPFEVFTPFELSQLPYVREGMWGVANHPAGTTYKLLNDMSVKIAAKTGTAQVVFIPQNEIVRMRESDMEYYKRSQAWMTSYGPYEEPKYAVTVLVEHGGGGGKAAGPLVRAIFEKLLEMKYIKIPEPKPATPQKSKKKKK